MGRLLFTAPNDLDVLLIVRDVKLERLHKYGAELDPELRDILLRSLKKQPAERWQTAGEFREKLQDFLFRTGKRVSAADLGECLRTLYVEGTADSESPLI